MFKKIAPHESCRDRPTTSKFALFSVFSLKVEKLIKKSKPTWKLKHTSSILEYFEYFCQMSSKSIHIILSYTVSKLVRFLRHSVDYQWSILIIDLNGVILRLNVRRVSFGWKRSTNGQILPAY